MANGEGLLSEVVVWVVVRNGWRHTNGEGMIAGIARYDGNRDGVASAARKGRHLRG